MKAAPGRRCNGDAATSRGCSSCLNEAAPGRRCNSPALAGRRGVRASMKAAHGKALQPVIGHAPEYWFLPQ